MHMLFNIFINNYNTDNNNLIIDIGYQNTRIGAPNYNQEASLLSSENIKIYNAQSKVEPSICMGKRIF